MSIIYKLGWFFKQEWKRYIAGIVALGLVSVLNLIPPMAMGYVVDSIASGTLTNDQLFQQLIYLLLSAIAMYVLRYMWRMFIFGTSYRLSRQLRSRLFEHFTKMSPSFFQKYRTGDLMAHATNDVQTVQMFASAGVMSFVDATLTAVVTLASMFFNISFVLTLSVLVPMLFMPLATSRIGRKNHTSFQKAQEAFSSLNNFVQESVSGVKVTKSFGYQTAETNAFKETNQDTFNKNMTVMKYNLLFDPVVLAFIGLSYTIALALGGTLIASNQMSVGQLITFVTYLDMLVWPLQAIGVLYNITQRGNVSYNRIEKILLEKSDVTNQEGALSIAENGPITYDINAFHYTDRIVLENIRFTLNKGQTLGIVGPTGAGKTTLLKLLLRQYDFDNGQISLNGHNIKEYELQALRGLIGYVPQDQILFDTSIRDNIRFSNLNLSDKQVEEAARICGIYDDVMNMPEKFNTVIGEKGMALSGGQRQRIAMSRAIVANPDILILDDSLSAVDAKTENLIVHNLRQNRQGQTTIITAHRLSAVVHADLIVVLDEGRIQEMGTHEQLIDSQGWYYHTYQSQQVAQNLEGTLQEHQKGAL